MRVLVALLALLFAELAAGGGLRQSPNRWVDMSLLTNKKKQTTLQSNKGDYYADGSQSDDGGGDDEGGDDGGGGSDDEEEEESEEEDVQPNFVVIFPDDFGYNDLSYTGGVDYDNGEPLTCPLWTYNLDTLALNGVILDHYYTGCVCTPARAALLTGRYMLRYGGHGDAGDGGWGLSLDETLVSEDLAAAGYTSWMLGKWHLGYYSWQHHPMARGFDEFKGFLGGGVSQQYHTGDNGGSYDWWDGWSLDGSAYGSYSTNLIIDDFENLVENTDGPFFAYVPAQVPHPPLEAPEEWQSYFVSDDYDYGSDMVVWMAELAMLDDLVGQIWSILYNADKLDDTYIIFAGDHGAPSNSPSLPYSRDAPFSGSKGTLYEGGVHVPAFIYNPNLEQYNITFPTSVTDWMPTMLGLAGASSTQSLDGMDLSDIILNSGDYDGSYDDRMVVIDVTASCSGGSGSHGRRRLQELETGDNPDDWHMVTNQWTEEKSYVLKGGGPSASARYGEYKLNLLSCIEEDEYGEIDWDEDDAQLFNVVEDQEESTDLSGDGGDYDEIVNTIISALLDYRAEAQEQKPDDNEGLYFADADNECSNTTVSTSDGYMSAVTPYSSCDDSNGYWECSNGYCSAPYSSSLSAEASTSGQAAAASKSNAEKSSGKEVLVLGVLLAAAVIAAGVTGYVCYSKGPCPSFGRIRNPTFDKLDGSTPRSTADVVENPSGAGKTQYGASELIF